MHLKSLKLAGFKSFVDKTFIPVPNHISAIVGPNGCGKSNIVDAIRWVIGETSAQQLRGQSMSDVVFNGTSRRKPVGKAIVELTFDNQEGRLGGEYAKFSEIVVRRELVREGQSCYFINGVLCRRRDIVSIFLGTGLGPRSYAVIEQGMVAQFIEAKPDVLRVYLEEVAGISKYKERRREAENRIRRTQENLDRLCDVIEELEKQWRHLKRQAQSAKRYQSLKKEEQLLRAQVKGLQWQSLAHQSSQVEHLIQENNLEFDKQQSLLNQLGARLERLRLEQADKQDREDDLQKAFYNLQTEVARLEQRLQSIRDQRKTWRHELEEVMVLSRELKKRSDDCLEQVEYVVKGINEHKSEQSRMMGIVEAMQKDWQIAESDLDRWQLEWEAYQKASADTVRLIGVAETHIVHYRQQVQTLIQRRESLLKQINPENVSGLRVVLKSSEQKVAELQSECQLLETEMDTLNQEIVARREKNAKNAKTLNAHRLELQAIENRYASLRALQTTALSGDREAVAWIKKHQLQNLSRLGETLKVMPGWEFAVEMVLRDYFDALCVSDFASLIDQVRFAKGTLTLINDCVSAQAEQTNKKGAKLADKILAPLSVKLSLATIYTADSVSDAIEKRYHLSPCESVITRDGLWMGKYWLRFVGPKKDKTAILVREKEIQDLKQRVDEEQQVVNELNASLLLDDSALLKLEEDRDKQHQRYQSLSQSLTQVQSDFSSQRSRCVELEQRQLNLQKEIADCAQQLAAAQAALVKRKEELEPLSRAQKEHIDQEKQLVKKREHYRHHLSTTREAAQQEQKKSDELEKHLLANEARLDYLKKTLAQLEQQLHQSSERRQHLMTQLGKEENPEAELNDALQMQLSRRVELEQTLYEVRAALQSHQDQVSCLESESSSVRALLSKIKDEKQSFRIEHQAIVVRQKAIQEQLVESCMDLNQILKEIPKGACIETWKQRIDILVQKIGQLGPINLAAIEECEKISERRAYLDKQRADLREALAILQDAIDKIDRETIQKFKATYTQANDRFKQLFPRVFGGGCASLVLTEERDWLHAGILVRAQPPGKRNTTIHMLSGGEKTLTAVALVLALFQLNPAPFCILDEVDAALDDVNIGRFTRLVKEMSEIIQFIIISHSKVTIEMADHLIGVTMQEPGVSRVVSVDVGAAIAMAEE